METLGGTAPPSADRAETIARSATMLGLYHDRCQRFEREAAHAANVAARIANFRVVTALAAIGCAGCAWWQATLPAWPWTLAAVGLAVAFVALVQWQRRVGQSRQWALALAQLNRQGVARIERNWKQLPVPPVSPQLRSLPLAADLDLFGSSSLSQLMATAVTPWGQERAAHWLVEPADVDEILARQRAVAELASRLDERQAIEAHRLVQEKPWHDPARFTTWLAEPAWTDSHRVWLWYARCAPVLVVVGVLLLTFGGTGAAPVGSLTLALCLLNTAVGVFWQPTIHGIFARISGGAGEMAAYAQLLRKVCALPVSSPKLLSVRRRLTSDHRGADQHLDRLGRLLSLADARFSPLVYGVLQSLLVWDLHVLAALENWKRRVGGQAADWLDALAEFEALAALGVLHHDHPGWVFPRFLPQGDRRFTATQLAHPLLNPAVGVANDVALGPPGSFLLVTGSNMSGKSTLLRAVGLNVVLAQCGAPVCAASLELSPVRLATSMRLTDSLADGVSLFLAELKRLKEVVAAARETQARSGPTVLYLLDEILHGTNSRERQLAVRHVVTHLLQHLAIGAISTHDLELGDVEPLRTAARQVHFQETIHGEQAQRRMTFDYRLRSGVATTTNALVLLELVGLGDPRP